MVRSCSNLPSKRSTTPYTAAILRFVMIFSEDTGRVERVGDRIVLQNGRDARAEVSAIIGAHLTSWTVDDRQVIFLSERAVLSGQTPIRGGIPICWPQFSKYGPLSISHGFARNSQRWNIVRGFSEGVPRTPEHCVALTLSLTEPTAQASFPAVFLLEVTFKLFARSLAIQAKVVNRGAAPFQFGFAFHPYFAVPDVTAVAVHGLRHVHYKDQLVAGSDLVEQEETVTIGGEVDRIYRGAPDRVVIEERASPYRPLLIVEKRNMPDLVVWNPWIEKSKKMATDFHPEEYRRMICVEPAQVDLITAEPGAAPWTGEMILTVP